MRKLSGIFIFIIIIAITVPYFPAASSNYSPADITQLVTSLEYGLAELNIDGTLKISNKLYIPIKNLFSEIGCSFKWDAAKSEMVVVINGSTLRAKPNCRIFTVNGKVFTSRTRIISKSGIFYIPLDFFSQELGLTAEEQSETGTINISGTPKVSVFGTLENLFPASPVSGQIIRKAVLYSSAAGLPKGSVPAQSAVEVLSDKNYNWYSIKTKAGQTGWVRKTDIAISETYKINTDIPTKEEIETYIDLKKLSSPTGYIVWVDISRQLVYILDKEGNSFKLFKTMKCSTGRNKSPTTRGIFTVKRDRGNWFYSYAARSGAKYWVRFNGVYLFHSIAMDRSRRIQDPTLGQRVSSGCVRLSVEDSRWIYYNLKEGSTVYVN